MTLSVETLLVVSLLMEVFAAVATVGTSLFLGAGYERLRNGFESIKKQTAFFSDAIHKLDGRVEGLEKQGNYFFEAITKLEQDEVAPETSAREQEHQDEKAPDVKSLIMAGKEDAIRTKTDDLLTASGFGGNSSHFH